MVKAFVFINTEPGREKELLQRLREAKGIKEVVYASIRRIEGVLFAMSMIVIEGKG